MIRKHGGVFDLQKSIKGPGFPWRKYPNEWHYPFYNYLGPGTRIDLRLDENMVPKPGEEPIDKTDTAALAHDIRYTLAEQDLARGSVDNPSEVLDDKHDADRIMLSELSKIDPSCFRERFAKWIAEQALKLKLKLGMQLGGKINPLTGKPMDPLYSNAPIKLMLDTEVLRAKREYENNPSGFPDNYVEEVRKSAERIKKTLDDDKIITGGDFEDFEDKEATELVNKYMAEYDKDRKEYDDHKAEEDRKAREITFIDRLIEIIEKPMKYLTDYTIGQIPVLKDYLTYDKIKAAITDGSKSKWEYRDEADELDKAIKIYDDRIAELNKVKKKNINYDDPKTLKDSPEYDQLCEQVSALRDARREIKKVLGYALPVFKGIRERLANELHSPIVHKFTRRSVFINALDDTWAADLMFLPNKDDGYKGILTVICCFSKYGWAIPIKTKKNTEMIEAFKTIFTSSNRKPKKLWTDKGSEYYGAEFKLFLLKNNIKLYSTESELKSVIIERWNRTLKEKMYRKFTELQDDTNWVDLLPVIVDEYNNTTHSSHKMTPVEASKPENEATVKQRLHEKMKKYSSKPPKFKVGDKVRIYSYKYTFDKGYKKNYTDEVFVVTVVHSTVPWTYSISDSDGEQIQGKFYNEEMIHSEFDFDNKLQKNKVYNL